MIIGNSGASTMRLGNGKTLLAVYLALRFGAITQRPIYSNIHLYDTDYIFLDGKDDLYSITGGIILLDDLYRVFRMSKKNSISQITQLWAGETRKDDDLLIYTSSRMVDFIDKNLRVHTDIMNLPVFDKRTDTLNLIAVNADEQPINPPYPTHLSKEVIRHLYTRYNTREKVAIW